MVVDVVLMVLMSMLVAFYSKDKLVLQCSADADADFYLQYRRMTGCRWAVHLADPTRNLNLPPQPQPSRISPFVTVAGGDG